VTKKESRPGERRLAPRRRVDRRCRWGRRTGEVLE
jgi:hypothetical protein